jgi:hypothetical protein
VEIKCHWTLRKSGRGRGKFSRLLKNGNGEYPERHGGGFGSGVIRVSGIFLKSMIALYAMATSCGEKRMAIPRISPY